MLFNSHFFILIFLPFVFISYFILRKFNFNIAGKLFLVLSSLVFYSWLKIEYIYIILFSILLNYLSAEAFYRWRSKLIIFCGILVNIGLLCYFKYKYFIISNIDFLFNLPAINAKIIIPLGISFYTFQQISFLVDVYRGQAKRCNFLDYTLFVSFFPQLIAGPISYHSEIIPQFNAPESGKLNFDNIGRGFFLFSIGLFKKLIIADSLAAFVTTGFDKSLALPFWDAWATSLSYTFQLYFDFSGYTDMALGIGLLFNIALPQNFNSPYKSTNIQEFWRRWHITLGRFVKDYMYIPLGGSRSGAYRTLLNLLVCFIVIGLWHGPDWNFVLWGAMHGIAIVIHRIWQNTGKKMPDFLGWVTTFLYINACWVIFRAEYTYDALKIYKGMLGLSSIGFSTALTSQKDFMILICCFCLILFTKYSKNSHKITADLKFSTREAAFAILLFAVSFLRLSTNQAFLYFNF